MPDSAIEVLIVTAPDAACCTAGTWASTAGLLKQRLLRRFPGQLAVEHVVPGTAHAAAFPALAALTADSPLPVVMVNRRVVSQGEKLADRGITRAIAEVLACRTR